MRNLEDFKNIADDIMSEINAGDELKEKTLRQCVKQRRVYGSKFLIPAACFIMVLGIVNMYGLLPLKSQTGEERIPENKILLESDRGSQTLPERSGDNTIPDQGAIKTWPLKSLNEAKTYFGSSFQAPSYIPQKFKLSEMYAQGSPDNSTAKVLLSYTSGDQSFMIIEEKTAFQSGFTNFKIIDINGAVGYVKPVSFDQGEGIASLDTEVHWFIDNVHYSVSGLITETEAVKVAKSMK